MAAQGPTTASVWRTTTYFNVAGPGVLTVNVPVLNQGSGTSSIASALVKTGSGLLLLAATSTYTGGTTVNGGTLALDANGAGNGTIIGTLTINPGAAVSLLINNALGYTAGTSVTQVNINGGVLDATAAGVGDEGYLANYTLTGGSITNSGGGDDFPIQGGYSVTTIGTNVSSVIAAQVEVRSANVTFNVGQGTVPGGVNLLISGPITNGGGGSGGIIKTGNGLMELAASSSYNGATVQAGTLQLGNSAALGLNTGTLTVNGGLLDLHGFSPTVGALAGTGGTIDNLTAKASTLTVGNGGNGGTFSGTIQNSSAAVTLAMAANAGTEVLSGTNTYTGGTLLNGGVLNFTPSALPFSTSPPNITFGGGTLQYAAGNTEDVSGGIAPIAAGQAAIIDTGTNSVAFNSPLSGSGGLTKVGVGTLTLNVVNPFTGPTTVSGGTLNIADPAGNALAASNGVTVNANGTLGLSGPAAAVGSVSGAGSVNLNNGVLTAGGNNANTTFTGVIGSAPGSATSGFIKNGTGTMTVTNNSTYSGPTIISAGTLKLAGAAIGASADIGIKFDTVTALPGPAGVVPMTNWNQEPSGTAAQAIARR